MKWLTNLITAELSALQMGHIPFSPNADKFDATIMYWVESFATALGRLSEDLDRPRIKKAFKTIRPRLVQWPTPYQVLELMPRRPELERIEHNEKPMAGEKVSQFSQLLEKRINGEITQEELETQSLALSQRGE